MLNNCRGCGAVPLADATFCHECGMQLISSQPTEKPVSDPEPKPEPEYMMLCVAGESALHSLYDGGTLDWSTLRIPAKQATLERQSLPNHGARRSRPPGRRVRGDQDFESLGDFLRIFREAR